jgi:hypothetical protein
VNVHDSQSAIVSQPRHAGSGPARIDQRGRKERLASQGIDPHSCSSAADNGALAASNWPHHANAKPLNCQLPRERADGGHHAAPIRDGAA